MQAKVGLACALAMAAIAVCSVEARRVISPLAIQGTWLGRTDTFPEQCNEAGYWVGFNSYDGKNFHMAVGPRAAGGPAPEQDVAGTNLLVAQPPAGAPDRIDLFLAGGNTEIGILIRTGSAIEVIPAGADKAYGKASLFLKRCLE
jgi:hypothetical protein